MKSSLASGRLFLIASFISTLTQLHTSGAEANPPPPAITVGMTTNGQPQLVFPFPATEQYTVFGSESPAGPFVTPIPGILMGPTFTITNAGPMGFYRVSAMPMASNALLSATILNRLTY